MINVDEVPVRKPLEDWQETTTQAIVSSFLRFGETHNLSILESFQRWGRTTTALKSSRGDVLLLVIDPLEDQQYVSYESYDGSSYLEITRFQGTDEQYRSLERVIK